MAAVGCGWLVPCLAAFPPEVAWFRCGQLSTWPLLGRVEALAALQHGTVGSLKPRSAGEPETRWLSAMSTNDQDFLDLAAMTSEDEASEGDNSQDEEIYYVETGELVENEAAPGIGVVAPPTAGVCCLCARSTRHEATQGWPLALPREMAGVHRYDVGAEGKFRRV